MDTSRYTFFVILGGSVAGSMYEATDGAGFERRADATTVAVEKEVAKKSRRWWWCSSG